MVLRRFDDKACIQSSTSNPEALDAAVRREQIEANILRCFDDDLGTRLHPKSVPQPVSPAVLCQVRSETDPTQVAMTDIFKSTYAGNILGNTARRVLLFRHETTAPRFCSTSEVADRLGDSGIEVCVARAYC